MAINLISVQLAAIGRGGLLKAMSFLVALLVLAAVKTRREGTRLPVRGRVGMLRLRNEDRFALLIAALSMTLRLYIKKEKGSKA